MEMGMNYLLKKLLILAGGGLALLMGLGFLVLLFKLSWLLFKATVPLAFIGGATYLGYRWWRGRALKPPAPPPPPDDDWGDRW